MTSKTNSTQIDPVFYQPWMVQVWQFLPPRYCAKVCEVLHEGNPEKIRGQFKHAVSRHTWANMEELNFAMEKAGNTNFEKDNTGGSSDHIESVMRGLSKAYMRTMPLLMSVEFDCRDGDAASMAFSFLLNPNSAHIAINSAYNFALEETENTPCAIALVTNVFFTEFPKQTSYKTTMASLEKHMGIKNEADLQVALAKNVVEHADAQKLTGFLAQIRAKVFKVNTASAHIEIYKASALRMSQNSKNPEALLAFANSLKNEGFAFEIIKSIITPALKKLDPRLELRQTAGGNLAIN
jgi:hypothetical protein